jgi:hypothetical protein
MKTVLRKILPPKKNKLNWHFRILLVYNEGLCASYWPPPAIIRILKSSWLWYASVALTGSRAHVNEQKTAEIRYSDRMQQVLVYKIISCVSWMINFLVKRNGKKKNIYIYIYIEREREREREREYRVHIFSFFAVLHPSLTLTVMNWRLKRLQT